MENNKQWINSKGDYYYNDIPVVTDKLPNGVYELEFDGFSKQFFLKKISDKFSLPEKVYGMEESTLNRIKTTFTRLDKNLGVLLKGLKGTGKTVLAKQVCNDLKLPVILVNHAYGNMSEFINSINQDVIMLFDEFEKTYDLSYYHDEEGGEGKSVNSLLTFMDGVFTSSYKRLFLLTTNKVYLPDAMVSRPSRIRYIKEFGDLSYESINEILQDSVEDKELIPKLAKILCELENITVDIVKSVAEEANIYGIAEKEFFNIFNIKRENDRFDIYEIVNGEMTVTPVIEGISMEDELYEGLYIRYHKQGVMGYVTNFNEENGVFTVRDDEDGDKMRKFKLVKAVSYHNKMLNYIL